MLRPDRIAIGRLPIVVVAVFALMLLALSGQWAKAQGMTPGGTGSATEVGVITAETRSIPYSVTLPGRAVAYQSANIRPTVEGIVERVSYDSGDRVQAGDLMFTLQRERYAAAVAAAQAEKTGAEGAVTSAQKTVERYRGLAGGGVTQADLDEAESTLLQAKATLSAAESSLTVAQLDLDGTEIRSPIDGVPSVSEVSIGAIVTANQTDALATVTRLDPIYVDMTESSARMLRVRDRMSSGELTRGQTFKVALTLENGVLYDGEGTFVSPGTQVSTTTGTLDLRLQFDNPDRLILPGQFLRVNVTLGTTEAIPVPQRATSRGSDGLLTAFVVRDGKATQVVLSEVGSYENAWIVTDGIAPGDKVIVDGLKNLHAGAEVMPVDLVIDASGLVQDAAPAAAATKP
ncbi:efflux RND transporter periplasmic adaptor subunit [Puniceibacterium sediminis]|uniref:Membrane fusion protein, multidrug efflux system n=1 Tax=Puniceibacterium sediminis TaxID=1608407 RepID=A0A238ZFH1_9RHOB|nr:efflux RND transporter periplasmic adaptor subunit [Puniceibacterium sediminis]SNR82236.1 membrane fusion protein, multidrug efflux system [Puniceibacterium sediminis]